MQKNTNSNINSINSGAKAVWRNTRVFRTASWVACGTANRTTVNTSSAATEMAKTLGSISSLKLSTQSLGSVSLVLIVSPMNLPLLAAAPVSGTGTPTRTQRT